MATTPTLPSTPRPDTPTTTDNAPPRERRRAREVSSRYMTIPHHQPPTPPLSPSHHPFLPPRNHHHYQPTPKPTTTPISIPSSSSSSRRSSSVERLRPPSTDPSLPPLRIPSTAPRRRAIPLPPPVPPSPDSDDNSSSTFGDENLPLTNKDPKRTRRRRAISKLFSDPSPTPTRPALTPIPSSFTPKKSSSPEKTSLEGEPWCESPPIRGGKSGSTSTPATPATTTNDCRSSADSVLAVTQSNTFRPSSSMCNRSLNSALSNVHKGGFFLNPKVSLADSKKSKKPGSNHRFAGDTHALQLLANRHLQWRFVNARSQLASHSRKVTAERSLHGTSLRLQTLRDSVASKRVLLQRLKLFETLRSVILSQTPYFDLWTTSLELEYSDSLSGITKALEDACLRLPIGGDVKVDVAELDQVLGSAIAVAVDALSPRIGNFTHQAGKVRELVSELANVVSLERDLIAQCGALLAEAQRLQVAESSLRTQLIQMKGADKKGISK